MRGFAENLQSELNRLTETVDTLKDKIFTVSQTISNKPPSYPGETEIFDITINAQSDPSFKQQEEEPQEEPQQSRLDTEYDASKGFYGLG